MPIDGVVIHRCETGHTGDEVKAAQRKSGLAYHYFIRRDGTVDQMYPDLTELWHARHWSHRTIAVAVHGDFVPEDKSRYGMPTEEQLRAVLELVGELINRYSTPVYTPWVAGHTELKDASTDPHKSCPGRNFPLNWVREKLAQKHDPLGGSGRSDMLPELLSYRSRVKT